MAEGKTPLVVMVSGGGPVGLTFSLNLVMMMGQHVKVIIYEARWFVDHNGTIRWQGEEQGRTRRDQVVTLQDHVIELMPSYIQNGLFQRVNERVWPTSRNIPIREVEDRLFDLIQPFVHDGLVELIPEQLQEQNERLINGDFDILVGADGANSFVRRYCNIPMISEGIEYACGVAYDIPDEVTPVEEPLHQALNCILTVSQTRYLVNSSRSRRGYLNIRFIQAEYDELRERLLEFQSRNESINLLDFDQCPQSPVWAIIRQGLDFFKISPKFVRRVTPIEINVRHASIAVRELRYELKNPTKDGEKTESDQKYKTALAFLAGDAALNVHFWPGRGMNSGMKAAIALARNILRTCTSKTSPDTISIQKPLRFLDFLDYEGFMARLRAREQQGRSLRVLINPIDKSVEASYSYAHLNHCYIRYTQRLVAKLKETRMRLEERPEWPHKTYKITDEQLNSAKNRISHFAVAQLSLANPWPTREMSGIEVLVEHTYPFDSKKFLPVPMNTKNTLKRTPSLLRPSKNFTLWIIGQAGSNNMAETIQTVYKISGVQQRTNDQIHEFVTVQSVEEAEKWCTDNSMKIRQSGSSFKVVTVWSLSTSENAVDVIRLVRAQEPQIPILIYTNKREEVQPALEFPNVNVTDVMFELQEFIGMSQDTQWNDGCAVINVSNSTLPIKSSGNESHSTEKIAAKDEASKPSTGESGPDSTVIKHPPLAPKLASADRDPYGEPILLWLDKADNDVDCYNKLRKRHPNLKIEFIEKYSDAEKFIETNIQSIRIRPKALIISRSRYKSEAKSDEKPKTAMDVVALLEKMKLDVPHAIYTGDRDRSRKHLSDLPSKVEIFDESQELIKFITRNLNK